MTARCPGPVAVKQAQIIISVLPCMTYWYEVFVLIAMMPSNSQPGCTIYTYAIIHNTPRAREGSGSVYIIQ